MPDASASWRPVAWDALVALAATAAAVTVPLALLPGFIDADRVAGAEWALTILFAADVVVQARRVRVAPPRRWRWAWTGVVLDGVAAVPFGLLWGPLLLLRLVKLHRVVAGMRALSRRFVGQASRLRLAYFGYGLALTIHLAACGFVGLGGVVATQPDLDRYLDAIYWSTTTLTTVGYGDLLPRTPVQKVYAVGVMLLGVGLYAFLIGNIASLISNLDPLRSAHLQRRERLDAFMRYRALPLVMRHRIQAYHDYLWEQRLVIDEETILRELPPGLRDEVALHLRRDLVRNVPLFQNASDAFLRDVALEMHSFVALPGDVIVREGDRGREMFFLSRGVAEAVGPDGDVLRTMRDGDFFGEIALLTDAPRTATVRAVTASDLYVLDRTLFDRVVAHYPEVKEALEAAAQDRHAGLS